MNIQSYLFWHRCLERQAFCTPRMYTLYPSKNIKESNYGEFLKDKNVLLCTRLYKYAPNLESLLTQQYVCVMCALWSDNTCVFTRFHCVKNANTQLIWSSERPYIVTSPENTYPCGKHGEIKVHRSSACVISLWNNRTKVTRCWSPDRKKQQKLSTFWETVTR